MVRSLFQWKVSKHHSKLFCTNWSISVYVCSVASLMWSAYTVLIFRSTLLMCVFTRKPLFLWVNHHYCLGFQFEAVDFSYLTLIFLLFLVFFRIVPIDEHILIHYFELQSIFYLNSLPSTFFCSRIPSRAPYDMWSSCLFRLFWACAVFETPFVSMALTLWRRTGQVLWGPYWDPILGFTWSFSHD